MVAVASEEPVCATGPLSPGLTIRIETLTLTGADVDVAVAGAAGAGAGGAVSTGVTAAGAVSGVVAIGAGRTTVGACGAVGGAGATTAIGGMGGGMSSAWARAGSASPNTAAVAAPAVPTIRRIDDSVVPPPLHSWKYPPMIRAMQ